MTGAGSPAVRRIQLGRELRKLRDRARLSALDAARELDCDVSKISKLESGKQAVVHAELQALARLYGATAVETDRLTALGREARRRSARDVPDWGRRYLGLEGDATEIRTYEAELVPGLLQTEGYARAVALVYEPTPDVRTVERHVEVRRERQAILLAEPPPRLWVVVSEAVIRRVVGGERVMREQLDHLLELSALPAVSLQIMPFGAGAHPAMGGSFVILTLTDPDVQLVYLEDPRGADYVEHPRQVADYLTLFDRLCPLAMDAAATRSMIEEAAGEMR